MQQVFVKEVKQEAIRNGQIPIVSEFMHDELAQNTQRDNERRIVFLWDASDGSGNDARRPMQSRNFCQKRASSNIVRANEAKANLVERQNVGVQVQLGIGMRVDDVTKVVGNPGVRSDLQDTSSGSFSPRKFSKGPEKDTFTQFFTAISV